jgi:hypothetical protein
MDPNRRKRQSGNVIIEFALLTVLILVPLFVGLIWGGINLGRGIQASLLSRDAAHMFAQGMDFGEAGCTANNVYSCQQHLIVRLAYGTGMTIFGGDGVVILSKVMKVTQQDCDLASIASEACTNKGLHVVTWRAQVGNDGLKASNFGTPTIDPETNYVPNYLKTASARAGTFGNLMNLEYGEVAFVVEAWLKSPTGASGVYSYTIF